MDSPSCRVSPASFRSYCFSAEMLRLKNYPQTAALFFCTLITLIILHYFSLIPPKTSISWGVF